MGSIWPCQMWIFLRQILIAQPWELCVPSLCGVPEAVSTPAGYFWCSLYAAGVWPCYLKACHLKSPNKVFPGYLGGEIRGFSLDLNLQRNIISGAEARDKYLLFIFQVSLFTLCNKACFCSCSILCTSILVHIMVLSDSKERFCQRRSEFGRG